jgi:HK97 family phage major capsid protein
MQEKREQLVTQARAALDEIKGNTDDSRVHRARAAPRHDHGRARHARREDRARRARRGGRAVAKRAPRARSASARTRPIEQSTTSTPATRRRTSSTATPSTPTSGPGSGSAPARRDRAVLQRGYQAIPAEQRAQTTTNAAGGYTVPVELQAEIIKSMKAFGPMYDPGVTRELVTSGGYSMPFPTVDDTANTPRRVDAGHDPADDGSGDVVFGQKALGAFSFATPWLRVSKELADDSLFAMEACSAACSASASAAWRTAS